MLVCGAACSDAVREAGLPEGCEEYEGNGVCDTVAGRPADDRSCNAVAVMLRGRQLHSTCNL
jgi:hypothetical protein